MKIDVSPIEIRDYALSSGWRLEKAALTDGLFLLNHPDENDLQIYFPKNETDKDFQELAQISLRKLSTIYKKEEAQIIEEIREVNDDVISLRYYSEKNTINSISFEEVLESIEATRQMLLSAASSVVNPSLFHPKLNRSEPQEVLRKARFRHTKEGSFVLKISCPFSSDAETKSIGRETFELINQSSLELSQAIESNTIDELYDRESKSTKPLISYNFCDSLSKLYDEERELPFELIFTWSKAAKLANVNNPSFQSTVTFPFSQKEKLEKLKERWAPVKKNLSGSFYGTVEILEGNIDAGTNRRYGQVILSVLVEDEILKTKISLNADQYDLAIKAHGEAGRYVTFKGDLVRSKRINSVENLSEFKLAE